jgi:hypothetical protein
MNSNPHSLASVGSISIGSISISISVASVSVVVECSNQDDM